ncbi:MAG: mechanosensitive ion channel [Planctomycetes bacterium]|jgi:potassium efflux system protein|nr:mechanosensitive ion channel [Planctomycetota bacterium]
MAKRFPAATPILALLSLLVPAWAQSPGETGPWGPAVLTPEAVAEELKRTEEATAPPDLVEADRAAWDADLARRKKILDDLRTILGRIAAFPASAQLDQWSTEAAETIRSLEAAGEVEIPSWLSESELEAHEQELTTLRDQRDRSDAALKKARAELAEGPKRTEELKVAAARLAERLAAPDGFPTGPLGEFLRGTVRMELRLNAEKLAFEQQLKEVGPRWNDVREQRHRALIAQVDRKQQFVEKARAVPIRQFEQELAAWERSIARDREEIAALRPRLGEAALGAVERSRLRIRLFEREMSARLAEIRAGTLRAKLFRLQTAKPLRDDQERRNASLERGRERLVARFGKEERHGAPSRTTELLTVNLERVQEQRAALRDVFQPQVTSLLSEQIGIRSRIFDQLWPLETLTDEEPDELTKLLLELDESLLQDARSAWKRWADRLKKTLEEQLDEVEQSLSLLLAVDDEIYPARRRVLDEMDDFIIRRIYWVRSDEPLGLPTITGVPGELAELARIYTRPALLARLVEGYRTGTWRFLLTAGAFVGAIALSVFLFRRIRRVGDRLRYRGGAILSLLQRIAVAFALSSLSAICLVIATLLLGVLSLPPAFEEPGQRLLLGLAIVLWARRALHRLFREEGIAMADLGATPPVALQLLMVSRWATAGALAIGIPWLVLSSEPLGLTHLPRILFTLALLGSVVLLAGAIRPRGALVRSLTGGQGVFYQAWFLLSPVVILGLLAIVAMDVLGYRFGARLLIGNVIVSFVAVLLLVAVYNVVTRVVHQAAAAIRTRSGVAESDGAARERSEQTLTQVTRLVTVTAIVVAVLLLARFWGFGRGLASFFDSIHLYTIEAEAGSFLTLWDILVACTWIAAGHFIVLHLPGLFEVLLFSRLDRSTTGTRYAVVTISKYVVFLVTYSAAVLAVKLSFSSLGYVVAALSVGIGFGLQEIVSNFISGLILMFERPIRVGDIVTVDGIEGTVEQINIRSTRIVNFDRQAIFIPNRKFISEDVINWSHNDQVIRSTINVGVAYGSDLEKVGRILLDVVTSHRKVLLNPTPQVLFMAFGESSLDFVVRPFTLIRDRPETVDEINREIYRRFAAEGIEIPFPQRDLHLRSIDPAVGLETLPAALAGRASSTPLPPGDAAPG